MLNQLVLVGRLAEELKIKENETGKYLKLTVAVPRNCKNENGEYDTDFIECIASGNIAEAITDYCKKGDVLGIKGRVQNLSTDPKNLEILAEKVTFLSSKGGDEK